MEAMVTMGEPSGWPAQRYHDLLTQLVATPASCLVPAAAGFRQCGASGWLNHHVHPVPVSRLRRDLGLLCDHRVLDPVVGATFHVSGGDVSVDPTGGLGLMTLDENAVDDRQFRPLEMPALVDPNLDGRDEVALRARVAGWVKATLAPAWADAWGSMAVGGRVCLVLEVVYPAHREAYTFEVGAGGCRVSRRFEDDYDGLNVVAGSMLVDVIEGRRFWGEILMGGFLRASNRSLFVETSGVSEGRVAPIFLYYALPYDESQARAVDARIKTFQTL